MIITKQLSQSIKWVTMLPGELGEIPTTDDAINCNNTTWIIKYLHTWESLHLLNNLVREEIFILYMEEIKEYQILGIGFLVIAIIAGILLILM